MKEIYCPKCKAVVSGEGETIPDHPRKMARSEDEQCDFSGEPITGKERIHFHHEAGLNAVFNV